jgi:uncharacterized membrane protein
MTTDNTSRTTPDRMELPVRSRPIHPILAPSSITCFAGAFVTDLKEA